MQASQSSQGGTANAQLPGAAFQPSRILVVDDDSSIRKINTVMLWQSGYDVDAAEDGAAAWDALNAECYDLLITDNQMPKVTGLELLKKLRAARMDMSVIMATGALPIQEFTLHPWLQTATTLAKPYTISKLLETVKKVLDETGVVADMPPASSPREILLTDVSTASAPPISPGKTNSPPRILVADEDRDLRLLYVDVLTGPGCTVDVAEDGPTAWEALRAQRYDLLITEHELPMLTGVELVRKLRAARMAVPVVMAAARLPVHDLARSPSLELAATLAKPFAVDELLDTVKGVLRATSSPREPAASPPNWQTQPWAAGWQV